MMSFDSTTKSARFPGVIDPRMFSLNDAHAESSVIPVTFLEILPLKEPGSATYL